MNKKSIIILIIFATIFITGFIFYIFYQKNTNIYEPISISIKDFKASDSNLIQISCISPIGRETPIIYNSKENNWNTIDDNYSKSIMLVLNDSIADKYKSITINFNYKSIKVSINNLEIKKESSNEKQYVLPANIRSEKSFLKKNKYIISRNCSIIIGFIAFILALTIISYLVTKYKNGALPKEFIYKWLKTICFSTIIAFGLFYGYLLIKFTLSSYITSVLFVIISGMILWYLSIFIIKLSPKLQKHSGKIKKTILIFTIIWFCTESSLRFLGVNKGYNETLTSFYSSGFNNDLNKDSQNPYLFVHKKQTSYFDKKSEFTYKMEANDDGLRDSNHSIEKQKDEVRIICLGNSFTEGIGAPQDSTWSKLLENKLKMVYNKKTTVLNAGISSSDPYFEYMLLKKRMLKYKPDLVLVALQVTDFNFYRFRGGFDRFTKDGCQFRKPPSWERLYAASYVFRYILNNILNYEYNYLQSQSDYQVDSLEANISIENCVRSFYELSLQENFTLAIVFLDTKGGSRYDFLNDELKKEGVIPVIDLEYYNKNIENLSDKELDSYFWKIDMHCNSKGYDLISKGILWNFNNLGILDSINNSPTKIN